jgi:hypothetical protein
MLLLLVVWSLTYYLLDSFEALRVAISFFAAVSAVYGYTFLGPGWTSHEREKRKTEPG